MNVATILHYSCRQSRHPTYLDLNLVFRNTDSFYKETLTHYTELLVPVPVIINKERYLKSYNKESYEELDQDRIMGYIIGDYFLDYLEKFDVYRFRITVPVQSATKGLIKYLNELCDIKQLHALQFYDLLTTLKSLNEFS